MTVWMVMMINIMHCFCWRIIEYNSGAVFIITLILISYNFITPHYCRPLALIIISTISMAIDNMTTNRYKLKSIIVFIIVVIVIVIDDM